MYNPDYLLAKLYAFLHRVFAMMDILEARGLHPERSHLMPDRFISIAYYALINIEEVASFCQKNFTMKELQEVYESILDEKLRRTTFQRKMLSLDILNRHEKRYSGEVHKAPWLYSFKK